MGENGGNKDDCRVWVRGWGLISRLCMTSNGDGGESRPSPTRFYCSSPSCRYLFICVDMREKEERSIRPTGRGFSGQTLNKFCFRSSGRVTTKKGRLGTFFFIFAKLVFPKMGNIFLPNKQKVIFFRLGRPTGHIYGHPLNQKQKFFFSVALE